MKLPAITGTVVHIGQKETPTANFSVLKIIVKTDDDQYPDYFQVEFKNLKIDTFQAAKVQEGSRVTVECFLGGRQAKNNPTSIFHSITGNSISVIGGAVSAGQAMGTPPVADFNSANQNDDLGF